MKVVLNSLISVALLSSRAWALSPDTTQNLDHLQERLEQHIDDGFASAEELSPLVIVEATGDSDDRPSLTTGLARALNIGLKSQVQICDKCQNTYTESKGLSVYESGFVDIERVRELYKGQKNQPKAALWARQSGPSLSLRIVSLTTGIVLYADTLDTRVDWSGRSIRSFSQSRLAERQARGDAILHGHIDFGIGLVGSGAHLGYSLMQQWGEANNYLSGLSVTLTDPALGIGINTFRVMPNINNALVGAQFLVSLPQMIGDSLSQDEAPMSKDKYVAVLMLKVPLFSQPEKYYALAFISTAGLMGLGLSW